MDRLCIYWEYNGGKSHECVRDNTPENRVALEDWAQKMQQDFHGSVVKVVPYPHATVFNMPGSLAALVAERQPSGRA